MENLLQGLVKEAFAEEPSAPVASAPKPTQKTKIASGPTSTAFLKKVAAALRGVASGIAKQAQDAGYDGYEDLPVGAVENSPDRWSTDMSGSFDLGTGSTAYSPPGQEGDVPEGNPAIPNLAGWVPENNYGTQPGEESPGNVDFSADGNLMALSSAGTPKRNLTPAERVKQAQARVLSRVQGAQLRRKQAEEDPTIVPNLGGDGGGTGDPGSLSAGLPAKADVPQSTAAVIDLTNEEAKKLNQPELEAALGPAAVAASNADQTQAQVLEHASGDEIPTDKQAALADILRGSVLARIAAEGG